MLFLLLGNGGVWAEDIAVQTLDFTTKAVGHSSYTDTWSWDNWNITCGANNNKGWAYVRLGGKSSKSGTNVSKSSIIVTKSSVGASVDYIQIEHLGINGKKVSEFKISSIVLETSSDANFSDITSETTVTDADLLSSSTTKTFRISPSTSVPVDSYYRIKINWSSTNTNNMGLDIEKVVLMKKGETTPSIKASDVTYAADITSGEILYTINNPVEGTVLTATSSTAWIKNVVTITGQNKVTFDMSENTETTPRTGTITLKYGDAPEKIVNVTQLAAVAKRTVTIETPENGTLKVYRGEEEVTSGSLIPQGTELRVEVTANEGYKFRNWQAVDGSTNTYTSTFTYTVGESNVTFSANFDEIVYHTITWSVNGVKTTEQVEEGTAITFATPAENIPEGYVFKGWYGSTLEPQDNAPEYVTSATATADFTYYAVFAKEEGSEPSLVKMTMNDDFIDGDKVVIVAKVDDTTSYGLYQETIGNTYVKNFVFTNDVNNIASDDKNWWTVSDGATANDGKWKLGDETNGYLNNNSSNDLNVNVVSTSEWTLEKDASSGLFKIKGGSTNRYISCRSDLTGDNKYRYRMAGGTPNGIYTFDIYKYISGSVVYSDFRTSVTALSTVTITIAEVCTDGNGMYYGTYSNSKAFVVPSDIIVSEISVIDNKLVVENYETGAIVPANTGVMVSSNTAGNHDVELSEAAGTSVLGNDNMLRPTGDNGITAADMAANDADCKYYRLTMHKGTTLGFFYGAAGGAAFNVAANKAYLAVPAEVAAKVSSFVIGGGSTTAIDGIEAGNGANASRKVYNLQGQRVSGTLPKGLYIIDGRKVIVK